LTDEDPALHARFADLKRGERREPHIRFLGRVASRRGKFERNAKGPHFQLEYSRYFPAAEGRLEMTSISPRLRVTDLHDRPASLSVREVGRSIETLDRAWLEERSDIRLFGLKIEVELVGLPLEPIGADFNLIVEHEDCDAVSQSFDVIAPELPSLGVDFTDGDVVITVSGNAEERNEIESWKVEFRGDEGVTHVLSCLGEDLLWSPEQDKEASASSVLARPILRLVGRAPDPDVLKGELWIELVEANGAKHQEKIRVHFSAEED
jgi:hypothetical protein